MFDNNDFENEETTPLEESFPVEEESKNNQPNEKDFAHNRDVQQLINKNNRDSFLPKARPELGNSKPGTMGGSRALNNALNKNRGASLAPNNRNNNDAANEAEEGEETGKSEDLTKQAADKGVDAALDKLEKMGPKGKIAAKAIKKTGAKEKIAQLVDKAIKKIKKKRIKLIIRILSPFLPYIFTFLAILLIISIVMSQIMLVMEGLDKALVVVSTGVDKIVNFVSGEGWSTKDQVFFEKLNDEYEESLKYSDKGLDIPLIADTIHYSKLADVSVYEKDVGESEPPIEDDSGDTEGLFSGFIEAEQMRNFYAVATNKLGTLTKFLPGERKLIGHMVDISFEFGKYDFSTALEKWGDYFSFVFGVIDDNLIDLVATLVNPIEMFDTIKTKLNYDDVNDGNADNFLEYKARNMRYEVNELFEAISSAFDNTGGATDVQMDENNNVNTSTGSWPAPNIIIKMDEQKYYDYLINVYIPGTYFSDGEYSEDEIEAVADEIFAQRDSYRYLIGEDAESLNQAGNNITVDITTCDKTSVVDSVSLYDYLRGVVNMEGGLSNPDEFLKAQAIAAKTFLFAKNNVSIDAKPAVLRIPNCEESQLYCSIENGCHYVDNGGIPGEYDSRDTIYSGPDKDGNYLKSPITDINEKKKAQNAVDSTLNLFYVEDDRFVTTKYKSQCTDFACDSTTNIMDQTAAIGMANNGSTYDKILAAFYMGSIMEINISGGYPLDQEFTVISSSFGWRYLKINGNPGYCDNHTGYDFSSAAIKGTPVYSVAEGVVEASGFYSGYGNFVRIGHGAVIDGKYEYYTAYAHMEEDPLVDVGETVKAGQKIGIVGSTGNSSGPHLHFEYFVYENGKQKWIEPNQLLKGYTFDYSNSGIVYSSEEACLKANGG